jgi:hypothetical protein
MKNIHIIPKEDWLINNPQCKQIESCIKSLSKKCICPKEAKQETLEEAFKKTYLGQRLFFDSNEGKSFEKGAKWQKEQDKNLYSEEEVNNLLYRFLEHIGNVQGKTILNVVPNEWFEQNKKK